MTVPPCIIFENKKAVTVFISSQPFRLYTVYSIISAE